MRGHKDDGHGTTAFPQLFFHLEPVDPGQTDVDDRAVGVAVLGQALLAGFE